ncbi:MAG: cytochrome c biogenesis protein CcsA, partial [Firmicutes bacterium]|nr:cytochrome c biogenesis protein CcsA [Bacillota bacterium]
PPTMYIGLIGMAVPAAYILAAVWTRAPAGVWLPVARRWMLFAWLFLTAAIVLGGMWAYMVLGWGGYWDWDPVENASLMPWLLATAFLHAAQVQERRGGFRWWTTLTGIGAFLLTLVGTYITRSGVLKDSVHSFTGTGVGPYFTGLFWVLVAAAGWVLFRRRRALRDPEPVEEGLSREAAYLYMSVALTAVTGIVLVGTFYPILSKALGGTSVVLTTRFFNTMTAPFFVVLLVLMGAAPALTWRRTNARTAARALAGPAAGGAVAAAVLWPFGFDTAMDAIGVGAAGFALLSMLREFGRAAGTRRRQYPAPWPAALGQAVWRNRRRYGGYLAHIGFIILALGVIGSHTGPAPAKISLSPGQSAVVDGYRFRYQGLATVPGPGHVTTVARLTIRHGAAAYTAAPGDAFYSGTGEPVARVFIRGGWMHDLYVVLTGWVPSSSRVTLEVLINPMVSWIWIGMYVMAAATLLALSAPEPRRILTEAAVTEPGLPVAGRTFSREATPR